MGFPGRQVPLVDDYQEPDDYYEPRSVPAPNGTNGHTPGLFDSAPRRPLLASDDRDVPGGPVDDHDPYGAGDGDGDDGAYDYSEYFEDDDEELVDNTSDVTRNALEWAVVIVGAVLVALVLRTLLFQAFYIPSESMETTLLINDRVLVNKASYRLHEVHRGDVVVFARPEEQAGPIRDLIKRVIALPGETVQAKDNTVFINGRQLVEPYLDPDVVTADFGPTVVPEGEIFVMGDNRSESFDSRVFGSIEEDRVVGRAFVLFWPLNRIGAL